MFSFLTLDESTFFYWTLSDVPPKRGSAINEWASAIPTTHSKSTGLLQGPKSISSRTKSIIPSLTAGSSSCSSATPVLTKNIKVISHESMDQVKVKDESQPDVISLSNEGGLSDNDELDGKEWEIAINSPPKGRKHINSEVTSHFFNYKCLKLFVSSNSYLTNPQRYLVNQHSKSLKTRNYPIGLKLNGFGTPLLQLIWCSLVKP